MRPHGTATSDRAPARHDETAPTPRWPAALLIAGGVLSALNGAAHFVLPVLYPWGQLVDNLYEPLRWALFATTWFFGALLVLAGVLTVVVARATDLPFRFVAMIAAGHAAFWVLAAAYEVAVPFPAPVASWILPLFSSSVAVLCLAGLWGRWRHTRR